MNKFTYGVIALVTVIVLFFGIVIYSDQTKRNEMFEKTEEHVKEVVKTSEETAKSVLSDIAGTDKEDLVAELGDTTVIDYVGTADGEEFEGGTATDYSLELGSGSFIEGFEDQLVDHKVGDVVEVSLTFPLDYASEDLQGKDVIFVVIINDIIKDTVSDTETQTA